MDDASTADFIKYLNTSRPIRHIFAVLDDFLIVAARGASSIKTNYREKDGGKWKYNDIINLIINNKTIRIFLDQS